MLAHNYHKMAIEKLSVTMRHSLSESEQCQTRPTWRLPIPENYKKITKLGCERPEKALQVNKERKK